MKKFIIILALIVSWAFTAYASSSSVGVLLSATGDVSIERNSTLEPAATGDEIYRHDLIVTGANAKAQIMFIDNTMIAVGADTELDISIFEFTQKSEFAVDVAKGAIRLISGKIVENNREGFSITTPHSTISIRGTVLTVNVLEDNTKVLINNISPEHEVIVHNNFTAASISFNTANTVVIAGEAGSEIRAATIQEMTETQGSPYPSTTESSSSQTYEGASSGNIGGSDGSDSSSDTPSGSGNTSSGSDSGSTTAPTPTPNPTPDPSPTPTPDPTPAPNPDPTPTPTPDPSPTPDPDPTPTPTPDPTPLPTPDPGPDPAIPSPDPKPTPTPDPDPGMNNNNIALFTGTTTSVISYSPIPGLSGTTLGVIDFKLDLDTNAISDFKMNGSNGAAQFTIWGGEGTVNWRTLVIDKDSLNFDSNFDTNPSSKYKFDIWGNFDYNFDQITGGYYLEKDDTNINGSYQADRLSGKQP